MQTDSRPLIDEKNPLYCPSVSAGVYLDSLKLKLDHKRVKHRSDPVFLSFARVLGRSVRDGEDSDGNDEEEDPLGDKVDDEWWIGHRRVPNQDDLDDSWSPTRESLHSTPAWEKTIVKDTDTSYHSPTQEEANSYENDMPYLPPPGLNLTRKRKRGAPSSRSFSDLHGPTRYARSIQSIHDSSFSVNLKREKLEFFNSQFPSSPIPKAAPVELVTPTRLTGNYTLPGSPGSPKIKDFVSRLDAIIPGIRLKQRLLQLDELTYQSVTDFLAQNGYINARVLECISSTGIKHLALSESMVDENGLNLYGSEFFSVFGKPNSFLFLSELSFTGTFVQDFDLIHIHHLPMLSTLFLDNTGIGNEAIFLLIPLKLSLTHLSLATNPHIDDDAVPAILLLSKLTFVSILDTSIEMVGLRRLAKTIADEHRIVDIEIPSACELYIDNLHSKYALNPLPPLVTDPTACQHLSVPALKRNLSAHAAQNPSIVPSGTKAEMVKRLSEILSIRKMDLVVRDMLMGSLSDEEDDNSLT